MKLGETAAGIFKKFFEDTTVKEADLNYLLFAQERVRPTPPTKPDVNPY